MDGTEQNNPMKEAVAEEALQRSTGGGDAEKFHQPSDPEKVEDGFGDWLREIRNSVMFVAAYMAFMAFLFMRNPPRPIPGLQAPGSALSGQDQKMLYGAYMVGDMVAFFTLLGIIPLLISGLPMKKKAWMWIYQVSIAISFSSLAVAILSYMRICLG